MKNKKCKYKSNIPCAKHNSTITNVFYYIKNSIKFKYKKSSYVIIKNGIILYKYINYNKTYVYKYNNLVLYGFKDVLLSKEGSIHSNCWNLTTTGGCKCNIIPNLSFSNSVHKKYKKVISISHQWGNAVFHSIIECLCKIGYYISELLIDTSIIIHTMKSANIKYLHFLGFNDSRIIYGNVYVQNLLVLEKGGCGSSPPLVHILYMRYNLRKKIKSKSLYEIVLIKRNGKRDIINFYEVLNILKTIHKNKHITIFYPNTTFLNTLNYFKYAKLIIAPHGAGLSNIIVSNKCILIEFLYKNLCYYSLAKNLGLEYYGVYENLTNMKFLVNITRFKNIIENINI